MKRSPRMPLTLCGRRGKRKGTQGAVGTGPELPTDSALRRTLIMARPPRGMRNVGKFGFAPARHEESIVHGSQ